MTRFALGWTVAALLHELLGAFVARRPLTTLAGASTAEALLVVAALAAFWALRIALMAGLPAQLVLRAMRPRGR